jgi:hypothetical protein
MQCVLLMPTFMCIHQGNHCLFRMNVIAAARNMAFSQDSSTTTNARAAQQQQQQQRFNEASPATDMRFCQAAQIVPRLRSTAMLGVPTVHDMCCTAHPTAMLYAMVQPKLLPTYMPESRQPCA